MAQTARAKQGQAAKADLVARLRAKRPQSSEYVIVLDERPLVAVSEAQNALTMGELTGQGPEKMTELKTRLEEAEAAAEGASETLTLHGLARGAYEALLLAHPPTDGEKEEGSTYDVDSFAPALVACCVVDPDASPRSLTVEDVKRLGDPKLLREFWQAAGNKTDSLSDADILRRYWQGTGRPLLPADVAELWADWNQGEVATLWQRAVSVSTQPRNPSLPFGSGTTRA